MLLAETANQAAWLTGGADGLNGVTITPLLGLFEFDLWGRTAYIYTLTILIVLTYVARRIVHSPFGLSLKAIKRNRRRAEMLGIPPNRRIIVIYTISAAYAGVAGALLAQINSFVSPDVLAFHRSADILLVLVIGGAGYLYGGLLGAVIFTVLREWLSLITPQYWMFWIGLILIIIVMVGRDRLTRWQTVIPMMAKKFRQARQAGGRQ
jgi:branched-chain amino acid transport system permease protein